jgi:hypothetical protein
MKHPNSYNIDVTINGNKIRKVLIGRHYELKHSNCMNDELILSLVRMLDEKTFPVDSTTKGVEYYVADIEYSVPLKVYRLIWLFEGEKLEVIGVINAYRRRRKEK